MTPQEAWQQAYHLVRLAYGDCLSTRGNPHAARYRLREWIRLVPETLDLLTEKNALDLAMMRMGQEPKDDRKESQTRFRNRQQNWRGELRKKIAFWKQEMKDQTMAYAILQEFKNWWLFRVRKPQAVKALLRQVSDAHYHLVRNRYFQQDPAIQRARVRWADGHPDRWMKIGDMVPHRRWWPGIDPRFIAESKAKGSVVPLP